MLAHSKQDYTRSPYLIATLDKLVSKELLRHCIQPIQMTVLPMLEEF
jgi:hypothetical protein